VATNMTSSPISFTSRTPRAEADDQAASSNLDNAADTLLDAEGVARGGG
jgi:hypothetical protein